MRKSFSLSLALPHLKWLWLCGVVAVTPLAWAESYRGVVVSVADGDTVTVLDSYRQQHKVRLAGVDAPEKSQAFGKVSRLNLARLVFGRPVTIEFDKLDRYRREVGKVWVAGEDINLEQLKAGLAWHYKKYEDEQSPEDRQRYALAESNAASAHRGLWRDPNPTPPWAYRKARRGR